MRLPTHRLSTPPLDILAKDFGIPREEAARCLPVTADSAAQLAERLGTTPEFWLSMQAAADALSPIAPARRDP